MDFWVQSVEFFSGIPKFSVKIKTDLTYVLRSIPYGNPVNCTITFEKPHYKIGLVVKIRGSYSFSEIQMKMKNVYFQTDRSFYIIFSLKVLNRYQRFIHSVGGFKKPT